MACLATSLVTGLSTLVADLGSSYWAGSPCWAGISWPAAGFALLSLVTGLMAASVEDLILTPSGIDLVNSTWVSSAAMLGTAGSFTLSVRDVQEVAVGGLLEDAS